MTAVTDLGGECGLLALLKADLLRYRGEKGTGFWAVILKYALHAGFRAVVLHRIGNWCARHRFQLLMEFLLSHSISVTGAEIAASASIGPGLLIHHPAGIVIGSAVLGSNCTILQSVTIGEKYGPHKAGAYPTLGDNVTVCAGACVIGDCHIGENSIIGANAVVLSDVPQNSIAIGVPAIPRPRPAGKGA